MLKTIAAVAFYDLSQEMRLLDFKRFLRVVKGWKIFVAQEARPRILTVHFQGLDWTNAGL